MNQHFDDVSEHDISDDSLFGSAVSVTSRVAAKTTRDGYEMSFQCGNCGNPCKVVLDWPEVVAISMGKLPHPQNWYLQSGRVVPNLLCRGCRRPVSPGVTPEEAQRAVSAGVHARFISLPDVQMIRQRYGA